jgi:hypothetical protein
VSYSPHIAASDFKLTFVRYQQLDKIENPGLSKGDLMRAKQHERERRRRKKAKKKALEKEREQVFGSREP